MRNKLLLIALILSCRYATANTRVIDSLRNRMQQIKPDTSRIDYLNMLAIEYQPFSPDTALLLSTQAYTKSFKLHYKDGMSRAATIIGNVYLNAGDYPKALEYYIKKLKIEEERGNSEILTVAIMQIAAAYQFEGEYKKAADYAFRADSIIDADKINRLKYYSCLNLGDLFEKSGNIPKAMDYTLKAYSLAEKENNTGFKGVTLTNLGNIYSAAGDKPAAIESYSNAIPYLEDVNDNYTLTETTLGLAKQYQLISSNDSSLFYAHQSYELSKKNGFLNKQLDACLFLKDFYKNKADIKNAFPFQEEVLTLKDSIFSKDKIAKLQFLTTEEELRQKEIAERKLEEEEERKQKIQYLTIGLLLPVLFFLTLYLSNRKIKPKYIEFLGIVSLLLTFEFVMLLLHPLIVSFSNHMPFYELIIFAVIASILTPLHHNIRNWLVKILTKKERISLMKIRIQ